MRICFLAQDFAVTSSKMEPNLKVEDTKMRAAQFSSKQTTRKRQKLYNYETATYRKIPQAPFPA
jgi:hypothetical protein